MQVCFYAAVIFVDFFSLEWTIIGSVCPLTVLCSIITSSTFSCEGRWNIVFKRIASKIDLKPLAPVFFFIAFLAISDTALSLKVNLTPSYLKSCWYCLTSEFFGSFKILTNDFSSKSSNVATIGKRPMNSGISPYFN